MNLFNDYARYYDLLYRDKDYAGEAAYVHALIQRFRPGARTILNLGCGSGRHDQELAQLGYQVTGVDLSETMISLSRSGAEGNGALDYHHGDVRSIRLDRRYHAVISLFHVMSYQTGDRDLEAAFETARLHLEPGGVFVFDCWYGPGVLTDPPTVRVKELEDDRVTLTRIARPVMHANDNLVDVNYLMFARDKKSQAVSEVRETHSMRYLFNTEIRGALGRAGLRQVSFTNWMTDEEPDFGTWNACIASVNASG